MVTGGYHSLVPDIMMTFCRLGLGMTSEEVTLGGKNVTKIHLQLWFISVKNFLSRERRITMRSVVVPSTETRCWGCMIRVTSTAGAPAKDSSAPEAEMNCKPCRWPPEESQQKTALYFPNYDTCLLFSWAVWTHSPWWHHSSTPDTWLKRQTTQWPIWSA